MLRHFRSIYFIQTKFITLHRKYKTYEYKTISEIVSYITTETLTLLLDNISNTCNTQTL